jgi:hypothetical protein
MRREEKRTELMRWSQLKKKAFVPEAEKSQSRSIRTLIYLNLFLFYFYF